MLKLFEYLNGIQYFYYARYFTTNVSNNLLSVTGFSVVVTFALPWTMGRTATLATCTLNQWAMDFKGNLARISESKNQCTLFFHNNHYSKCSNHSISPCSLVLCIRLAFCKAMNISKWKIIVSGQQCVHNLLKYNK